jgi:hypothetical protein
MDFQLLIKLNAEKLCQSIAAVSGQLLLDVPAAAAAHCPPSGLSQGYCTAPHGTSTLMKHTIS